MEEKVWKALIIDDEEGIRKVLSITLSDAGYQVLTAANGESGVRLCLEQSPQIVLTDIRLPGIDGIEALGRIKAEKPDTEVIVITAFGQMDIAVRALQLNASDFITKPINNEALFIALERAKERFTVNRELKEYTELIENRWMDTAAELAKTFDFQNNLIENSMDGIMGCDRGRKVITYNRSMEKMLGYPKEEVIRKMSFDQFFPGESAEELRKAVYSEEYGGKNRLFLFESYILNSNKEKLPVQISAVVLFEEGEEVGMVGFFRDLREIRRLEQQFADQARLLHQHKMMSIGRLTASIVHEINNPLAGILNYIRLMIKILKRGSLDENHMSKFKRYLEFVESETGRCSKIVSNLLAFSRKSKLEFSEVNISELLEKCVVLSQHRLDLQNIRVTLNLTPDMPGVRGDFNQIQQCIINLILNAVDAMPDGGSLLIEDSFRSKEGVVEIKVSDTGNGIVKEDLPHIFEPFYTTKMEGEGLGLGLSTVYGIIDRHKGTISVDSQPGKGTVFTIKIPVESFGSSSASASTG